MTVTTGCSRLGFVAPLPGLGTSRWFTLEPLDEDGLLFSLRSEDDPELRLVLAAAGVFFPEYAPEIEEDWVAALGLETPDDAEVLLVLTVRDSVAEATANLLAPVVVHRGTGAAAQIVLTGTDLPVRAPLAG